jgi:oligopeptide/dipeptide ABC transporter ATP-binding protein
MNTAAATPLESDTILTVEHLVKHFPVGSNRVWSGTAESVKALDDVSFSLTRGETLGIVGESGCGKTTLARCLVRLLEPSAGTIRFRGEDITHKGARALRPARRDLQMVFQDPQGSLNPRTRVRDIVKAGVRAGADRAQDVDTRVQELLSVVGLAEGFANRFPAELSGGQRQRVGVARALAVRPQLIILDEPVSALDVSIQAQLINLLDDLQEEFGLSYLFVAHDLAVVRHVSDRVGVMYLGKMAELASVDDLFARPIHPYTHALMSAIPTPRPRRDGATRPPPLGGEPPSPLHPPTGCRFHPRCPRAKAICRQEEPSLMTYSGTHVAACHHPMSVGRDEIAAASRSPLSPITAGNTLPTSWP